jgi:hypothetical protein
LLVEVTLTPIAEILNSDSDMTYASSANVFTWLAGATTLFQLALVAGAPWGTLTQGGRFAGALPFRARIIALISAGLLLAFIYLVRIRARSHPPARFRRAIWIVVAYCALGIVANALTSSSAERALWFPVVSVMFLASLHVARRPEPRDVAP